MKVLGTQPGLKGLYAALPYSRGDFSGLHGQVGNKYGMI